MADVGSARERGRQALDSRYLLRPHVFVTVVALVAGVLLAVLIPPLRGADETDHLDRAFQLAFGDLSTVRHGQFFGALFPAGFENYMLKLGRAVFISRNHTAFTQYVFSGSANGRRVFVNEGTIASYGPGAYVDYVPFIKLGLLLRLPIGLVIYLARIVGATTYALLVGLATKRLPGQKWALVAVALIPAMLTQAATVSADGITNALTLLLIAWFFRLCADRHLTRVQTAEICVAIVILATAKPPYFLFIIPILYVVARNWSARRLRLVGGVGALSVPLFLLTTEYQRSHSTQLDLPGLLLNQGSVDNYAYRNVDTTAQTRALLHSPWQLLERLYATFQHQGLAFPKQLVGFLSGYQSPGWLVLISIITVFFAVSIGWSVERTGGTPLDGVVMATATVICALAISASVYVLANAVGAPRIDGLTPRYFLPLIPGLILGLASIRSNSMPALECPVQDDSGRATLADRKVGNVRPALLCSVLTATIVCSAIGMIHFFYSGPAAF
jgi:uncharacterized membrane protein